LSQLALIGWLLGAGPEVGMIALFSARQLAALNPEFRRW
jgi:hypothetical protein